MIKSISDMEFYDKVENSEGIVVVDFFATWCVPCKMLENILENVSNSMRGKAEFFRVDVEQCTDIADEYDIAAIPTMIIFKDGVPVESISGFRPEQSITNIMRTYL